MKERFGRPKGPSKEDIEREAERELARLTRNAPGPSTGGGGGFGGPPGDMGSPLDQIASSVRRGRPSAPEPNLGVLGSVGGGPGGYKGGAGEFDRGLGGYGEPSGRRGGGAAQGPGPGLPADFEDPEEERATITELALRDLAARDGANPDELVIRQDPGMAEAMRDEAMRRFFDRQQTRQPVAATPPIDPADTVLGRLAARRKAEEEGRTLDEDDDAPSGGGLLDRVRRRQEAEAAQTKPPSGRRATGAGSLRDRRGGKGPYEVDDDDDDDGPAGLRARVRARRRDEVNAENRPGRVFAMPFVDDAAQGPGPDPELAAVASRLYEARAKTAGRGSGRAGGAKKTKKKAPAASAPTRARKAKPAAKAAAKRAGGTRPAPKATKAAGGARAASSRRAPATEAAKGAAGKAAARKSASPAKRATRAPAKATRAPAKATRAPAKRATKATTAAGTRASRRR